MRAQTCLAASVASLVLALVASPGCNIVLGFDKVAFESGGGGTAGTGGTGGTTTIPADCIPSNTSTPVDDVCGVFVSSSTGVDDDTEERGSKAKPYATLAQAIAVALAKDKPIYACAEVFTEAITVKDDATFYGGLDCAKDWAHVGSEKKTSWTAAADAVPLHLGAGARLAFEDFAISAAAAVKPGGSSIAVLAEAGAKLDLAQCDITAGDGAPGEDGASFEVPAGSGFGGNAGGEACFANQVLGGDEAVNACDSGDPMDDSIGGSGGNGQQSSGGAGSPGSPLGAMNAGQGEMVDACTDGTVGDDGPPGLEGSGADGTGKIGPEGYTGVSGGDGQKGKAAQGGGGGGGTKGVVTCAAEATKGGASGGSGGSGGCPGSGGKGGQAGGASIGILSLGAGLTFEGVNITTGNGGKGGNGADGQTGGPGGAAGKGGPAKGDPNTILGCKGGFGGKGGDGGKGGGGLGGHSLGIAHTLDMPMTTGAMIKNGKAGVGGTGGVDNNGAAGLADMSWGF